MEKRRYQAFSVHHGEGMWRGENIINAAA